MDYDQLVVATTYDAARALTSADAIVGSACSRRMSTGAQSRCS